MPLLPSSTRSFTTPDDTNTRALPESQSNMTSQGQNSFDLKVVACDQVARGPFPKASLPCGVTSAKVGDLVTIPCTGYFGCDQDDVKMVTWFTKAKASDYSSLTKVLAADDIITQTDRHVIFSLIVKALFSSMLRVL
ncbi:hypothetical protein DPMN_003301 [Dreissena polymorpha]|uniref:Uncharacterized protein n=1 Tax=Dreissena polymorpha TaxID=45954 RepID=A0A9D4MPE7_DREPO|nr:hypothetical protein DPMN_003301 [Dreissena polymorpha]